MSINPTTTLRVTPLEPADLMTFDDSDDQDNISDSSDSSESDVNLLAARRSQVPKTGLTSDWAQEQNQAKPYDATMRIKSGSGEQSVSSVDGHLPAHAMSMPAHQNLLWGTDMRHENFDLYKSSPLFTSQILESPAGDFFYGEGSTTSCTQYGLVGVQVQTPNHHPDQMSCDDEEVHEGNNMVIANMDMPWSAFICGSQGAGKSHTLSCLLENALLDNNMIGSLPHPLAGMVFHYDNYTTSACSQVCEAAYLCSSGVPVTVLVSPSNIWAMTEMYNNLPGLPADAPRPKVLPLYLSESLLDIATMLKLMAIDPNAESIPLYMSTVMIILREMAMEGKGTDKFSYDDFRRRLAANEWESGQLVPLSLRLQLLDSFLEPTQYTRTTRPAQAKENIWAFEPGTLTIIDLSDPFVNSNDACSLFSICLSLFLGSRDACGRVLALDEAHKFLLQSGAAKVLTNDLTSVIRQQRHTGTRVLIATQEPTLSPELIDLANATFVHRFLSPAWYEVLRKHLAGASQHESTGKHTSLFDTIVKLETGQALLFCPTALVGTNGLPSGHGSIQKLGNGYMRVKIRQRISADGGTSILASETRSKSGTVPTQNVPMHVVVKGPQTHLIMKGKARIAQLLGPVANAAPSEPSKMASAHASDAVASTTMATASQASLPVASSLPGAVTTRTSGTNVTHTPSTAANKKPMLQKSI